MKINNKPLLYLIVIIGNILVLAWTSMSVFTFFLLFSQYGDSLLLSLILQLCLLLGLYLPLVITAGLIKLLRNISVFDYGIVVKYPLKKEVTIKWTDIQEVSIGYFYGNGHIGDDPRSCVFFVRNGEKKGSDGRWKINDPFHIFKVYAVPYSISFYNELNEKCPIKVVDKRNTLLFKEYWDRDRNQNP